MKILLLITVLLLVAPPMMPQVQPFIQASSGAESTGYRPPVLFLNSGLDIEGRRVLAIDTLDLSPAVAKTAVKGLGYQVGGTSLNYWRVSRFIAVGGGASALTLHTSSWQKSSVFGIAGAAFDGRGFGRLYVNYYRAAALDQNHMNELKITAEFGHGRFRPVVTYGLAHFTEPSYCRETCVGIIDNSVFIGVKVMLWKAQ